MMGDYAAARGGAFLESLVRLFDVHWCQHVGLHQTKSQCHEQQQSKGQRVCGVHSSMSTKSSFTVQPRYRNFQSESRICRVPRRAEVGGAVVGLRNGDSPVSQLHAPALRINRRSVLHAPSFSEEDEPVSDLNPDAEPPSAAWDAVTKHVRSCRQKRRRTLPLSGPQFTSLESSTVRCQNGHPSSASGAADDAAKAAVVVLGALRKDLAWSDDSVNTTLAAAAAPSRIVGARSGEGDTANSFSNTGYPSGKKADFQDKVRTVHVRRRALQELATGNPKRGPYNISPNISFIHYLAPSAVDEPSPHTVSGPVADAGRATADGDHDGASSNGGHPHIVEYDIRAQVCGAGRQEQHIGQQRQPHQQQQVAQHQPPQLRLPQGQVPHSSETELNYTKTKQHPVASDPQRHAVETVTVRGDREYYQEDHGENAHAQLRDGRKICGQYGLIDSSQMLTMRRPCKTLLRSILSFSYEKRQKRRWCWWSIALLSFLLLAGTFFSCGFLFAFLSASELESSHGTLGADIARLLQKHAHPSRYWHGNSSGKNDALSGNFMMRAPRYHTDVSASSRAGVAAFGKTLSERKLVQGALTEPAALKNPTFASRPAALGAGAGATLKWSDNPEEGDAMKTRKTNQQLHESAECFSPKAGSAYVRERGETAAHSGRAEFGGAERGSVEARRPASTPVGNQKESLSRFDKLFYFSDGQIDKEDFLSSELPSSAKEAPPYGVGDNTSRTLTTEDTHTSDGVSSSIKNFAPPSTGKAKLSELSINPNPFTGRPLIKLLHDMEAFLYAEPHIKQRPPRYEKQRCVTENGVKRHLQQRKQVRKDQQQHVPEQLEEQQREHSGNVNRVDRKTFRQQPSHAGTHSRGVSLGMAVTAVLPARTNLAENAVRVVGSAAARRLAAEDGENQSESPPKGDTQAAQLPEKGSCAGEQDRKGSSSVSKAGRNTPPLSSAGSAAITNNGRAARSTRKSSLRRLPEERSTKGHSSSEEVQKRTTKRSPQRVLQRKILTAVIQSATPTAKERRKPLLNEEPRRRKVPRVTSIPALKTLLAELSATSRKQRAEEETKRKRATGVTASVGASSFTDEAATASPSNSTRVPRATGAASGESDEDADTALAIVITKQESKPAEGKVSCGDVEGETCSRREDDKGEQSWDVDSVDDTDYTVEGPEEDDSSEEASTHFIQQQEEEAARRTKLKGNTSIVPALSAGGGGVATNANLTYTMPGLTRTASERHTREANFDTGVMKTMWETRDRLAKLAKKKLRVFNNASTRRQVCKLIQSDQQQYKLWFTLAALFAIEWPLYSYADEGGLHFLGELLEQTRSFAAPLGSSPAVQQRYEEFRVCHMPAAFEEGVGFFNCKTVHFSCHDHLVIRRAESLFFQSSTIPPLLRLLTLMDCIPSGAELPAALAAAAEHPAFAKVLHALGDVHVPLDNRHSLAHVFDMVEAAMGLAWGKNFFIGKNTTSNSSFKPFTAEELFEKYTYAFSESRRYFSMIILLFRAMRQHVTQKPHTGIILLLVEQPESPLSKEKKKGSFYRLQDFRILQAQVRRSVVMKLESALMRFYPSSRQSSRKDFVDLPDVRVSGFFARDGDGSTVEKGLVGVEIDFSLIEKFKQQTPKFGVMIQVNLLDTWADKNSPEAWPDVLEPYNKVLSAYAATQLLKSELLWDPSLASLAWGKTKFIYSSIAEVFEYEKVRQFSSDGSPPPYDPDLHVMLLQSYKDFVVQGREDGVMKRLISALKRKPLGHARIPRTFKTERVQFQGSAMLLTQAPIRKTQIVTEREIAGQPPRDAQQSSAALQTVQPEKRRPKEAPLKAAGGKAGLMKSAAAPIAAEPGTVARQLQVGTTTGAEGAAQPRKETPSPLVEWETVGRKAQKAAEVVDRSGIAEESNSAEKRQLYRKREFGAGLNYGEVLLLEKAIRENTIMLHIKIKGLGNAAAEDWQSLQAHEILHRLAQRLRGAFEIHYVEAAKPRPTVTGLPGPPRRKGVVPEWVLTLSVCATAIFFICFIALMTHHNNLVLPWWLSCLCSRFSPWEIGPRDCSGHYSGSISDAEYTPASPVTIATSLKIVDIPGKSLKSLRQTLTQKAAVSTASTVAALMAARIRAAQIKAIYHRGQIRRVRYRQTRLSRRKSNVKRRLASGNSPGRWFAETWPGHSSSQSLSQAQTGFTSNSPGVSLSSGPSVQRLGGAHPCAVLGVHGGSPFSFSGHSESYGASIGKQRTAKASATLNSSGSLIDLPHCLSRERLENVVSEQYQQDEPHEEQSEQQRIRQQAECEGIMHVGRCIRRITRASRIVLENSICSPPELVEENSAEMTDNLASSTAAAPRIK